jgi:hypothetical protein
MFCVHLSEMVSLPLAKQQHFKAKTATTGLRPAGPSLLLLQLVSVLDNERTYVIRAVEQFQPLFLI